MAQIAHGQYVGTEIATENLKQRFHQLSQRVYDPTTRKYVFMTASQLQTAIMSLVQETEGMDAATVALQVPELDSVFYHALVGRLQQRADLAELTQLTWVRT